MKTLCPGVEPRKAVFVYFQHKAAGKKNTSRDREGVMSAVVGDLKVASISLWTLGRRARGAEKEKTAHGQKDPTGQKIRHRWLSWLQRSGGREFSEGEEVSRPRRHIARDHPKYSIELFERRQSTFANACWKKMHEEGDNSIDGCL